MTANIDIQTGEGTEIIMPSYIGKIPGSKSLSRQPQYEKKIKIGKFCVIGPFTTIYVDVEIGDNCLIAESVSIREKCRIGNNCIIGRCTTINYNATIGNNTKIMDCSHITGNCLIGNNVFISVGVTTTNDRSFGAVQYDEKTMRGPTIEDNVSIGANASILPDVRIGKGSIVAAGSIVTKDVPPGAFVRGDPAVVVTSASRLISLMKARKR